MGKDKQTKWILALLAFGMTAFVTGLLTIMGGYAAFYGFAVDSEMNVYVGRDSWIHVYQGNRVLRRLSPQTSRGYAFRMENDELLVYTGSDYSRMDLQGEVLERIDEEDLNVELRFRNPNARFTAADGTRYRMTESLLHGRQIRNVATGETIWKQRPAEVVTMRAAGVSVVCALFSAAMAFLVYKRS